MNHTFHIPVLGLGYSIDTPIKVAPYGISSVASIVDDIAIERVRKFYLEKNGKPYTEIDSKTDDARAKRITAYLDMMLEMVDEEFENIKNQSFEEGTKLTKYFDILPNSSVLKHDYLQMLAETNDEKRILMQQKLRGSLEKGSIDINIMSKVDKMNVDAKGELKEEIYSDALAALRGFANSKLASSMVLSAGMNPRLYSYLEAFPDFLPDDKQQLKKKLILKVSDFRSAFIQAKFLAKKGIWVSEFRIESGLNCGGHAFATEGFLLGPILDEFKQKRAEMLTELFTMYQNALSLKFINIDNAPFQKISVQGGIGTAAENEFLTQYYQLDATGWGSPFLLVPEVTAVDDNTLSDLANATEDDFYISGASPLGIPFNNFRKSGAEKLRLERIEKGKPGSPCTKKFLVSNTEFSKEPICTASNKYQKLKIKELQKEALHPDIYQQKYNTITEKICLCEGLVNSYYTKNNLLQAKESTAVAICPGPNLAFFKGPYKMEEMIAHIYGKTDLLSRTNRPHIFINELKLYIDYLKKDIENSFSEMTAKKEKYLNSFSQQLQNGIDYYKKLAVDLINNKADFSSDFIKSLELMETKLKEINVNLHQPC